MTQMADDTPHIDIVLYGLPQEAYNYLDSCARIRHVSRARLIRNVLRVVCTEQLVLAVLDDDSRPENQQQEQHLNRKQFAYHGSADAAHTDSPRTAG